MVCRNRETFNPNSTSIERTSTRTRYKIQNTKGVVFVEIFTFLSFLSTQFAMAPDADKLRQRKAQQAISIAEENATQLKIGSLKGLAGTEIVIDGDMFDIADFDHPGGESILLFGGNDVSITYKMIHPYHTAKHLEKLKKVGKVPDYHSE
jgi:hypothetical protein